MNSEFDATRISLSFSAISWINGCQTGLLVAADMLIHHANAFSSCFVNAYCHS
jgi:hypothetical protein